MATDAINKKLQTIHEQERGRRLALEIPRFNWLEEKILNSSSAGASYSSESTSQTPFWPNTSSHKNSISFKKSKTPPFSRNVTPVNLAAKTSRSLSLPSEAMRSVIKPIPLLIPNNETVMAAKSPASQNLGPALTPPPLLISDAGKQQVRSPATAVDAVEGFPHEQDDSQVSPSPPPPSESAPSPISSATTKRNSLDADIDPNGLFRSKRCHLQAAVPPLIPTSRVTPIIVKRKISPPSLMPLIPSPPGLDDPRPAAEPAEGSNPVTTTQISSVSSSNLHEADAPSQGEEYRGTTSDVSTKRVQASTNDLTSTDQEYQPNEPSSDDKPEENSLDDDPEKKENILQNSDVPVSQKLSILTEAFKNKLNTCMDSNEAVIPSIKDENPSNNIDNYEERKIESPQRLEINLRSTPEESSVSTDQKTEVKMCSSSEVNSSNSDDNSKITSSLSTEEESPILISIPDTIPSLESVLRDIKVSGGDALQQNLFNIDKKPTSEPSLFAALYEELMRTRKEVEKLRKVQEQMLNSERSSSSESPPVDLNKVKLEKKEDPKPSPPLIDISDEKESERTSALSDSGLKSAEQQPESSDIKFVYDVKEGEKRVIQQDNNNSQSTKRLKHESGQDQNVITIRYALPSNSGSHSSQHSACKNVKLRNLLGIVNSDLDVVPVPENKPKEGCESQGFSIKNSKEKDQTLDSSNVDKPELVKLLSTNGSPYSRASLSDPPSLISSTDGPLTTRRNSDPSDAIYSKSLPRPIYSRPNVNTGLILKKSLTEKPKSSSYNYIGDNASKLNVISVPEPQSLKYSNPVPIVKYKQSLSLPHPLKYASAEEKHKNLLHSIQLSKQREAFMVPDNSKEIQAPTFHPKILIHPNGKPPIHPPPQDWHHPQYQSRMHDPKVIAHHPMGAVPRAGPPNVRIAPRPPNITQSPSFHPSTSKMADIFPVHKPYSSQFQRNHPMAMLPDNLPPHAYKNEHAIHINRSQANFPRTSQVVSPMYPSQPPSTMGISGSNSQHFVPSIPSTQCPPSVPNMGHPHAAQIPTPRVSPNTGKKLVLYTSQHQRSPYYHPDSNPPLQRATPPNEAAALQRITPPQIINYQHGPIDPISSHSSSGLNSTSPSPLMRPQQMQHPLPPHPKMFAPPSGQSQFPPQQRPLQQPAIHIPIHPAVPPAKITRVYQSHPVSPSQSLPQAPPNPARYEHKSPVDITAIQQNNVNFEHKVVKLPNEGSTTPEQRPESQSSPKQSKCCLVCRNSAQFLCSGCKMAWYCSRNCQRDHWAVHSPECQTHR